MGQQAQPRRALPSPPLGHQRLVYHARAPHCLFARGGHLPYSSGRLRPPLSPSGTPDGDPGGTLVPSGLSV